MSAAALKLSRWLKGEPGLNPPSHYLLGRFAGTLNEPLMIRLARPHELLKLRIKDVEFISGEDGSRYAKIVVNGKTGERALPLIDAIPYITQWISLHPQGTNREAILLPNKKTGKEIQVNGMLKIYTKTYREYFTSLLSSSNVPDEDKKKITDLLKKPWNPYVHRHSAITEKSGLLSSDAKLRQFAGWTARSNMHHKYVHFSGGESMKDLLRAKGILKEDKKLENILQPKPCPHCREPNRPDAQFCAKCNFVMSFEAYQNGMEERDRKDQEINELKEQMKKMGQKTQVVERQLDSMEYWIWKLIRNLVQPGEAFSAAVTEAFREANRQEEPIRVREGRGTEKEISDWLATPNLTSGDRQKLEILRGMMALQAVRDLAARDNPESRLVVHQRVQVFWVAPDFEI
ncbi:MAG: site-specific integrase [Candidatus Nitrosopolaris sp.]